MDGSHPKGNLRWENRNARDPEVGQQTAPPTTTTTTTTTLTVLRPDGFAAGKNNNALDSVLPRVSVVRVLSADGEGGHVHEANVVVVLQNPVVFFKKKNIIIILLAVMARSAGPVKQHFHPHTFISQCCLFPTL